MTCDARTARLPQRFFAAARSADVASVGRRMAAERRLVGWCHFPRCGCIVFGKSASLATHPLSDRRVYWSGRLAGIRRRCAPPSRAGCRRQGALHADTNAHSKARHLLEIAARGELDLAEHMRAVLRQCGEGRGSVIRLLNVWYAPSSRTLRRLCSDPNCGRPICP